MENYKIDFVIPWVDGSDPEWRKEKNKYWNGSKQIDNADANNDARFRDWGNLRYWFRAVEKFAPWVNNIYFVTCGQIPDWLDTDHPKLKFITHKDYIPSEYLPVFSANPIEINFHRIPGLSEHFVYFNDDMFLISAVTPEDFFLDGLPREMAIQYPLSNDGSNDTFQHMLLTMAGQVNQHFNLKESIRKNFYKWYNPCYGKYMLLNLYMFRNARMSGLVMPHVPSSLRKSTMETVWDRMPEQMQETSRHRFRNTNDITQYMFRFWEIMSGTFVPTNIFKYGIEYHLHDGNYENLYDIIVGQKYKMICINDSVKLKNIKAVQNRVIEAFQEILPNKSEFER